MANRFVFSRLSYFTGLTLLLLVQSSLLFAYGGDKREQKRWYTKQLRLFMWSIDDALSRQLSGQDVQASREAIEKLAATIGERLVSTRQDQFQKAVQEFLAHLPDQKVDKGSDSKLQPEPDGLYLSFQKLRDSVYQLYRVRNVPSQNPDLELGRKQYLSHCASCHGDRGRGDGVLTKNPDLPMKPMPTDFVALNRLGVRNAFSYFNTMLVGLDHSTMRSFSDTLTSHEMWSIAFYLLSHDMRAAHTKWSSEARQFKNLNLNLDLGFLATQSDQDLKKWAKENSVTSADSFLDWIRNDASFRSAIPRKI